VLLANAAAVLFFRFFISVDGPMQVLRASLFEAPWAMRGHMAHGIIYDSAVLPRLLGDRILTFLLLFFAPERTHDIFSAVVSCCVVLAVLAFLRAHGTRWGLTVLWLAPLSFNLLLIMGLFNFLLGVAICFGSVAWWKARPHAPRARWAGLLIGAALAWYVHRSAPILLCMIFLPTLLIERVTAHRARVTDERVPIIARTLIVVVLLVLGMIKLGWGVQWIPIPDTAHLPAFDVAFLLRPFFLLDHVKEQWSVHALGVLLLISTAAASWARFQMGRMVRWHDALLVLFLGFATISWLYDTPHGQELLITARSQWLALMVLAMWLIAMADAQRGRIAQVIGGAALCALPVQLIRLVQAEESFSHLKQAYTRSMEACDALAPGSLVMPVMAEPDRLLQHLEAYVAIAHDGILLASKEIPKFQDLTFGSTLRPPWLRQMQDPYWSVRYWRSGIPPEVDQVLFIGSGIERAASKHPWPVLLGERYRLSYDNGYARIYTAMPRKYGCSGSLL